MMRPRIQCDKYCLWELKYPKRRVQKPLIKKRDADRSVVKTIATTSLSCDGDKE